MKHVLLLGEPFSESVDLSELGSNNSKYQLRSKLRSQSYSRKTNVFGIMSPTRTQIIKPTKADKRATASNPIDTESIPCPMQTEFTARFD